MDMHEAIKAVVLEVLLPTDVRSVNDYSADLSELGMDSMHAIVIMYKLEDQYGIEVPNESIAACRSINDIAAEVTRLLG